MGLLDNLVYLCMQKWRQKIHDVIFEADTTAGKTFDVLLLVFILASLLVVMLDSVVSIHENYLTTLFTLEWFFTIVFSIEYILRIISVKHPLKYIFSFDYMPEDSFDEIPNENGNYISPGDGFWYELAPFENAKKDAIKRIDKLVETLKNYG